MTVSAASDVYFDPYDVELNADPYPMLRRLREEVPLLKRFPEWDVDLSECKLSPTSIVRGWEKMPAVLH